MTESNTKIEDWLIKHSISIGIFTIVLFSVVCSVFIELILRIRGGATLSLEQSVTIHFNFLSMAAIFSLLYAIYAAVWRDLGARYMAGKATATYKWATACGHVALLFPVLMLFASLIPGIWTATGRFPWRYTDPAYTPRILDFLEGFGYAVAGAILIQIPVMLVGTATGALCGLIRKRWPGPVGIIVLAVTWLLLTTGILAYAFAH